MLSSYNADDSPLRLPKVKMRTEPYLPLPKPTVSFHRVQDIGLRFMVWKGLENKETETERSMSMPQTFIILKYL